MPDPDPMPLDLHDLLAKGYFPKELPPPFTSLQYADALAGAGAPVPAAFLGGAQGDSRPCTHNLVRTGGLRRLLAMPNPVQFFRLAQHVVNHWPALKMAAWRSKYSLTRPMETGPARAITPEHDLSERALQRAELRANGRFILTTDISRFFPSIYTHSIPWALMGKDVAKAKFASGQLSSTWEDKLDGLARACNSKQTIGIPIGPDTSRLIAEVVLGRIDEELATRHGRLRGIRHIDDYEFVTGTRAEAEAILADLQHILNQYELALNPSKTKIRELPVELEPQWTPILRIFQFRNSGLMAQRTDLAAYFNSAFDFFHRCPEEGLLKYAIGRLRAVDVHRSNWPFYEAVLNQSILVEPACIPQVCDQVLHYKSLRFKMRKSLWTQTLNRIICDQLPLGNASEAAWALWLMKILSVKVHQQSAKAIGDCSDSVTALMGLGLASVGQADLKHFTPLQRYTAAQSLTEEQWLLCYQSNLMGWLGLGARATLRQTPPFDYFLQKNVSFFDISVPPPAPVRSSASGGGIGY